MDIDPQYKDLIHTDATALLRPKTGLKDMFIELNPGSDSAPVAKAAGRSRSSNTLPDINPDEIFSVLDTDTRDYLQAAGQRRRRGPQGPRRRPAGRLRALRADAPRPARVSTAVATRRSNLRRLVNSLNLLNGELAARHTDLAQLVNTSSAVFRSFASEDANISRAVADFPGALRQTTTTLGKVQTFANVLGPTAEQAAPGGARAQPGQPRGASRSPRRPTPILRTQIRPVRARRRARSCATCSRRPHEPGQRRRRT